jgi:hypothetical protein
MGSVRALTLVVAGLAGASTAAALSAVPHSGLFGVVMRGPITPVCRIGVPCDAPAAKIILTFRRPGLVRTTRTDEQGRYRIVLPAGVYLVRTSARPFGRVPRPANVHVRSGHLDKIDFTIDTGIR